MELIPTCIKWLISEKNINLEKSKQIRYLREALKMCPSIGIVLHKHLTIIVL